MSTEVLALVTLEWASYNGPECNNVPAFNFSNVISRVYLEMSLYSLVYILYFIRPKNNSFTPFGFHSKIYIDN